MIDLVPKRMADLVAGKEVSNVNPAAAVIATGIFFQFEKMTSIGADMLDECNDQSCLCWFRLRLSKILERYDEM